MEDLPIDGEPPAAAAAGGTGAGAPQDYRTLLATAEAVLDDVDRALARLDEGTYGTCEVCGSAIDEERLAARPAARSCGAHPTLADGAAG